MSDEKETWRAQKEAASNEDCEIWMAFWPSGNPFCWGGTEYDAWGGVCRNLRYDLALDEEDYPGFRAERIAEGWSCKRVYTLQEAARKLSDGIVKNSPPRDYELILVGEMTLAIAKRELREESADKE